MMKRLTAALPFLYAFACHAQEADSTDPSSAAIKNARQVYYQFRGAESNLYNGPAVAQSTFSGKGTPYYGTGDWFGGSVFYDGTLYENVMLRYDLVLDQLVALNPTTRNAFYLFKPRVDYFMLGDKSFINLKKSGAKSAPSEGFYEQLVNGSITLLKKDSKTYQESYGTGNVEQRFDEKTRFYALKDGVYHELSGAKSLYALCGSYKNQITDALKKQSLSTDNTEQTLTAISQLYNQLTK